MTPGIIAYQAPLSIGFPRQEYWIGFPFPSPGVFPDPGIKALSPALPGGLLLFFLTNESPGKPYSYIFTLFLCSIWYCSASFLSKAFSLSLHDLAFSSIFSFAGYLASVILLKVGVLQGSPQAPWLVPYTWFSWVISSTPMVSMMSRLIKYKSTYLIIYLFFEHLTLIITY